MRISTYNAAHDIGRIKTQLGIIMTSTVLAFRSQERLQELCCR